MTRNHTNHFVQPVEMRRRVMPNDVLLQAVPRIVVKPAAYENSATLGIFSRTMSSKCIPMPYLTPSVSKADDMRRLIYGHSIIRIHPQEAGDRKGREIVLQSARYPANNQKVIIPPERSLLRDLGKYSQTEK